MANEAASRILWRVRMIHTLAWAVFASAIVAIPLLTTFGELREAAWVSLLVWLEVAILAVNRMHCPLAGVAARYTEDRSANFDIFLPAWLSQHNKLIFGVLFGGGEIVLLWRFLAGPGR
jgi:hypothetical protein